MNTHTTVKRKPSVFIKITEGIRFGSMVAVERVGTNGRNSLWRVRCDCGLESVKIDQAFKHAKFCSFSCPLGKKNSSVHHTKHGMRSHPGYSVWCGVKNRCYNTTRRDYPNYGGRGISMCPSWLASFESFWSDMGPTWKKGLQLDRINNEGNYEPANCRWATCKENNRNRRSTTTPSWVFEKMDENGVNTPAYFSRVYKGWSIEDACTIPLGQKRTP